MKDYLFRCSSLGALMTEPRSKSSGPLSETAKSHIQRVVAEDIFGVEFEIHDKRLEKGRLVEQDAIAMVNRVRGLALKKNTERRSNGWITGEADCFDKAVRVGHDTKCPWSVATFPLVESACFDRDYWFQMQGYMILWDAEEWHVQYALLDTPEALVGFEPQSMHFVSHIPEHLRLTTWRVQRDRSLEPLIEFKVKKAREYMEQVIAEFDRTHPESGVLTVEAPPPWEPPAAPAPAAKPAPKAAPAAFALPDF